MPLAAMLGASLLLASTARAESNLLQNSPFLPSDISASSAQPTSPFELRSVLIEDGQYEFSLYDIARKQSTWIFLNKPVDGLLVRSFDAANRAITVEQRGRTYTLALKEAKIAALGSVAGLPPTAAGSAQSSTVDQETPTAPISLKELAQRRNRLSKELADLNDTISQASRRTKPLLPADTLDQPQARQR
jgi:hypothetical protein